MIGTYLQAVKYLADGYAKNPNAKWEVKEAKEKRSLSQNSYYWKLITEVARKQKRSVAYIHNTELRAARYAKWFDDQLVLVSIPDTDEAEAQVMEQTEYHLAPTNRREGDKRIYVMLRGSSDFTTSEMSHLLDLLIQDAQALGIETMTPDELERIRAYEYSRENKSKSDTSQG